MPCHPNVLQRPKNYQDCAKLIEGYYRKFLSALRNSALVNSGLILFFVFVASSLLMLGGCKPKQLVNEQYVAITDSTTVLQMSDSLQIKEWQMSILRTHFNRFIEDNFNLESKTWQKEINYDTDAQIDSVSGKHPVLSEVVSINIITFEKSLKDHEALIKEDSIEKTNVSTSSSNMGFKVEKLLDETRSVETEPVYNFSMRYVLVCVVVVLFLVLTGQKIIASS